MNVTRKLDTGHQKTQYHIPGSRNLQL